MPLDDYTEAGQENLPPGCELVYEDGDAAIMVQKNTKLVGIMAPGVPVSPMMSFEDWARASALYMYAMRLSRARADDTNNNVSL